MNTLLRSHYPTRWLPATSQCNIRRSRCFAAAAGAGAGAGGRAPIDWEAKRKKLLVEDLMLVRTAHAW